MNLIFGNPKQNQNNQMVLKERKRNSLFFFSKIENSNMQIDWEKIQKQRLAIKRNWITGTAHLIKCSGHKERY